MVYSPFDINEASRHREDFVDDRLREGSPIVGISCSEALLLLTIRRTQRKVFEIYDRLIFSAIGRQADIERVRISAIDVAHKEGFDRSPDDVTAQRLVGFALSPALRQVFGDQFNSPYVLRAVFGELNASSSEDAYFILNYDGEFAQRNRCAAVAGTPEAEEKMLEVLSGEEPSSLMNALAIGLKAWAAGSLELSRSRVDKSDDTGSAPEESASDRIVACLEIELRSGHVEAGILERHTRRESRFALVDGALIAKALTEIGV